MKLAVGLFGFVVLGACSSFSGTDPGAGDVGGGDGGPDQGTTMGTALACDPGQDPNDTAGCVADEHGLFVDSFDGSDANNGTKASPLKTIGAALTFSTSKPNIYVCEGTYHEHVTNTRGASIFGGFACSAWTYSGTKPKLAPTDAGVVVSVTQATSAVIISDLEVVAAPGTDALVSSVAMFVGSSTAVTLRRLMLTAGAGAKGAKGLDPLENKLVAVSSGDVDFDGINANGANGGAAKTCTCTNGTKTTSGAGGGANGDGTDGTPRYTAAGGKGQTERRMRRRRRG